MPELLGLCGEAFGTASRAAEADGRYVCRVRTRDLYCRRAELRRGVTVRSLAQAPDGVTVTFDDGCAEEFDAVAGCDGMHSRTRDLVFGPAGGFVSGWLLWTWWAGGGPFDPNVAREWCGPGSFFGIYPVPGQVMCAAGGPAWAVRGGDVRLVLGRQLGTLCHREPAVAAAIDELDEAHPWAMADRRSRRWFEHRVALCGDSAVASCRRPGLAHRLRCTRPPGLPTNCPGPTPPGCPWRSSDTTDGAAGRPSAPRPSHAA